MGELLASTSTNPSHPSLNLPGDLSLKQSYNFRDHEYESGKSSWRLIFNPLLCQLSYFPSRNLKRSDLLLPALLTDDTKVGSKYDSTIFTPTIVTT